MLASFRGPARLLGLLLLAVCAACARTNEITPVSPAAEFEEAERRFGDGKVKVQVRDGSVFNLENLSLGPDSVSGASLAGRTVLSLEDVASIEAKKRGRGALHGFLIGASTGAVIGALDGEPVCEGFTCLDAWVAGLISGAIWGPAIGALVGSKEILRVTGSDGGTSSPGLRIRPVVGRRLGLSGSYRPGG